MSKLVKSLKAITANAVEKKEAIGERIQMTALEAQVKEAELRQDGLL